MARTAGVNHPLVRGDPLRFLGRRGAETNGTLTFVDDSPAAVDTMQDALGGAAREKPHENERYDNYQFFAGDLGGRTAEFQYFH